MIKKTLYSLSQYRICKLNHRPGHFYSPIVSYKKIKKHVDDIFSVKSNQIPGIELRETQQIDLLEKLSKMYSSIPFNDEKKHNLRYYYKNSYYSYSDAVFLHLIIRHFNPKSIIEIWSGFSSAVMLDTNNLFFENKINITFIEPYPKRLFSLLTDYDKKNTNILTDNLQNIDLEIFDKLNENDILFIDSTHVSKTGSDVNKIIFQILPRLKKGVLIHFHDIFFPFEYPLDWVKNKNGFGWNEAYILKSFLMYNTDFEIVMFNTFLEHFHEKWFAEHMPLCLKNKGGSIWIQKLI